MIDVAVYRALVIDGHNDLPWALRTLYDSDLDRADLLAGLPKVHTDIPRLHSGGVTGQFWAAYVPSTLPEPEAVLATLQQIDLIHRMVERHPDHFAFARTADEVEAARAAGRIASLIGVEGGHSIGSSLAVLRVLHRLGARYLTLTHNDNTRWADSATDTPVLHGMNEFGEDVVRDMNRLGMMVDLSHVSADVMRHALRVSSAPVVFSHSSARAVCDVPRNVPDDVLSSLAGNGGVCMVTFVSGFVSQAVADWVDDTRALMVEAGLNPTSFVEFSRFAVERSRSTPPPSATIDDVVRHVEHVREVAGVEHVGIGGDFDGTVMVPDGLHDVSCYPRLFDALRARKWSEADLRLLATDNALRVMRAVEHCAAL